MLHYIEESVNYLANNINYRIYLKKLFFNIYNIKNIVLY